MLITLKRELSNVICKHLVPHPAIKPAECRLAIRVTCQAVDNSLLSTFSFNITNRSLLLKIVRYANGIACRFRVGRYDKNTSVAGEFDPI